MILLNMLESKSQAIKMSQVTVRPNISIIIIIIIIINNDNNNLVLSVPLPFGV